MKNIKTYLPFSKPGCKYEELEIEVYYSLGGINYFSGNDSPRGYKLSLHPVTRHGMGTTRTLMTSSTAPDRGIAFHIEDTNRFSAKKLQQIEEKIKPLYEELKNLFQEDRVNEIFKLVTNI